MFISTKSCSFQFSFTFVISQGKQLDNGHHDTQQCDAQHNNIQHNDTHRNDIQHNNKINATRSIMSRSLMAERCNAEYTFMLNRPYILSALMLSVVLNANIVGRKYNTLFY